MTLTIVRLDGSEEARPWTPGEVIPGNWRFGWARPNQAVLVEVAWLDFFGGSGLRIEAQ
jgi:hypothetical protein